MITKDIINNSIIKLVSSKNMSYMEAILQICEEYNIEYDVISKILDRSIVDNLEAESQSLNLIKGKSTKLPI